MQLIFYLIDIMHVCGGGKFATNFYNTNFMRIKGGSPGRLKEQSPNFVYVFNMVDEKVVHLLQILFIFSTKRTEKRKKTDYLHFLLLYKDIFIIYTIKKKPLLFAIIK